MTDTWAIHQGDCIPGMADLDEASVDLTVTSIPFGALFMYSGKNEDIGNNEDGIDMARSFFGAHLRFWAEALFRVQRPGTHAAIHIQQLITLRIDATVHLWSHPQAVGKVISFPDLEERGDGVEVLWRGERSSETFPACFPDARRARRGDETLMCEDLVLAEDGS